MILINTNRFLVIHHYNYSSNDCSPETYHKFALSLFDLKSEQINVIFNHKTDTDYFGMSYYTFNYFSVKNKFLFQISDFNVNNKYIKEDHELILEYNIFNIKTQETNLSLKTCFKLMSHYKDDLIFAQNYQNLFICNFNNNNTFRSVYKFNFNISHLTILKNKDLIFYGKKKINKENKNDAKDDSFEYKSNFYYYYKVLDLKK